MNPIYKRLLEDVPMVADSTLLSWLTPSDTFDRATQAVMREVGPADVNAAESPFFRWMREQMRPVIERTRDGFAIIPVEGVLALAPSVMEMYFYGLEDTRTLLRAITESAADPEVSGILLNINSPGGMVVGGVDVADAVGLARKKKPVVAWTGGNAASLGYAIAIQADEFIATRMSSVGSIGGVISFVDYSRYLEAQGIRVEVITNREGRFKGTGTSGTALNEHQRDYLQKRIQSAFEDFKAMVVDRRPGVSLESMQGQSFWAGEAKELGLVDRIGDLAFALSHLRVRARSVDTRG